MSDFVKLINHSSIHLSLGEQNIGILTDPWFSGLAFNNGWSLLYENKAKEIQEVLEKTNYIYISHEHPDHFSIKFFKDYDNEIKKRKIKILFQKTRDKRVEKLLIKKNFDVIILKNQEETQISENIFVRIFKQGHMDSGLLIETDQYYHININDCEFFEHELNRIKKHIKNKNKKIIIYVQFSYAAFRSNEEWLKLAAKYKLDNIKKIHNIFNSSLIIPFASFIYFCHLENFILNKNVNNCGKTSDYLSNNKINHCFLNPSTNSLDLNQLIENDENRGQFNKTSINFWDKKISQIKITKFEEKPEEVLEENIKKFLIRIKEKNNLLLLYALRYLSYKFFFGNVIVRINNTKNTYVVNFFKVKKLLNTQIKSDISISSDQFNFLLRETYGVDTLLVGGRMKEDRVGGLKNLALSIGFTAINQSNYGIKIKDIFNRLILYKIIDAVFRIILRKS